MAAELAAEFTAKDYATGYVCVGPNRRCSPHITIASDGVWFRERPDGMLNSAHRQCLSP